MHFQRQLSRLASSLVIVLLAACGGGADPQPPSGQSLQISFSASSMVFTAPAPFGTAAPPQTLTGTLTGQGSGTLYIVIQHNSPNLGTLSPVSISGTSGSVTIQPALPGTLGVGSHAGSMVVRACLNDPTCNTGQISGSPQTISLRYDVPDIVAADTVTPKVVLAATAGTVVLRGHGFTSSTTVLVGTQAATQVVYVSPTELRVGYPALPAGNHNLTLSTAGGATFAQLTAVAPVAYAAQFFANPVFVRSQIYDAVRRTLYMVDMRPSAVPSRVVRHRNVAGVWEAPISVDLPNAKQVLMSHDNSRLYVLVATSIPAEASLVELDPVTLATLASTTLPTAGASSPAMVRINDGNLLLLTGGSYPLMFSSATRQSRLVVGSGGGFALISADGGEVFLSGAGSGEQYLASTARFVSAPRISTGFNSATMGSTTTSGPVKYQAGTGVYDAQGQLIGIAPGTQTAAVIRPDGTRLYTLDRLGFVRTYDLTVAPITGGMFPSLVEIGSGITLAGVPGGESDPPPQMSITPDGGTLFIAGHLGLAIQPVP